MVDDVKDVPTGSAIRKTIRERTREAADWVALDTWLNEVGNVDGLLSSKRSEVARLEAEEATVRARVKAARTEGEQIAVDAAAEAERIKQQASALMDDAEAAKAEADDVLNSARAEARKIVADAKAQVAAALLRFKE